MSVKAAKRYANAFLETAVEQKSLEKAKEDILLIHNTISESSDLRLFLDSPIIKNDQKKAALAAIFKSKVGEITLNLLKILSEKKRENILGDITKHFLELYNAHHGIIEVNVGSAEVIESEQLQALIKKLEDMTGKKVEAKTSINKDLIGGVFVRINDTVIDGTVKFKLNRLKEQFASVVAE